MAFLKKLLGPLMMFVTAIAEGFFKVKSDEKQAKITEKTHEETLKDISDGKPTRARNRLLTWLRHKSSRANKN